MAGQGPATRRRALAAAAALAPAAAAAALIEIVMGHAGTTYVEARRAGA